ncbi:MAG: AMP-binding protein [Polyangiaceae bacterium]|nr:AMP-binding protein [Polyangiaceae bacterium]
MRVDAFWQSAQKRPRRTALVDVDGSLISAGELLASGNQLARAFQDLGIEPGQTVAFMLPNGRATVELLVATMQIGLFLAPLNNALSEGEIAHILADSAAAVFISHEKYGARAAPAAQQANTAHRFSVGGINGFASFDALKAGQGAELPATRRPGALMVYTSGTTGRPKGIERELLPGDADKTAGYMARQLSMFDVMPGGDGVHLCTSPLYHTAPLAYSWYSLCFEHTLVLMNKWDAERALELIEAHRVTHTHMVPTQFHRLLCLPETVRARYDVSSLRNVLHAAAPCPVDTKRKMLEWWGPVIYEYYGASEGGGTLVSPEEWLEYPGTVGRPWKGAEIQIHDADGALLPPGEPGTVYMKLLGAFTYRGDEKKTRDNRRGGFFTVGDIGYLNEQGYLFLCDRKIDMIISGGVNIYPAEVEGALLEHPDIADAAVFGIPDDDWGESVMAVVEWVTGRPTPANAELSLKEHCASRIAKFKVPRAIDFADSLPRDPNGKLMKRKLRAPYWKGKSASI